MKNYGHDVMEIANALVSNNNEVLRSDAVKQAHIIAKLKHDLRKNHKVTFRFMKKDGTLRVANGTLHEVILNEYVKGTFKGKVRHDVIKYFDLDKNQFRSFNAMSLVG